MWAVWLVWGTALATGAYGGACYQRLKDEELADGLRPQIESAGSRCDECAIGSGKMLLEYRGARGQD